MIPIKPKSLCGGHPHLWGRAESVRMAFRQAAEAGAPYVFGVITDASGDGTSGLRYTFLIMLKPLFVIGLIALIALRTYTRDAATAIAYWEKQHFKELFSVMNSEPSCTAILLLSNI